MNSNQIFRLPPMALLAAVCAFAQTSPLAEFNDMTAKIGQRMAKMGVGISDVGHVEMLVRVSNPFSVPPGKLTNPILLKESVLLFDPALEPTYFPATKTGCDVVDTNNAAYCEGDNTIYYDPIFLAAIMKEVGRITGTDGFYGVLTVIAHELGHAIAYRKYAGYGDGGPTDTFAREQYADCAAGALTARAQQSGVWPRETQVQARAALALVADPAFSLGGHGTAKDRVGIFNQGYQNGNGGLAFCTFTSREDYLHRLLRN